MSQNLKYLGWALAGGAVGAAMSLLAAPASGRETRRRIGRRIEDERDELLRKGSRAVENASEFVQDKIDHGRRKLAQAVNG